VIILGCFLKINYILVTLNMWGGGGENNFKALADFLGIRKTTVLDRFLDYLKIVSVGSNETGRVLSSEI
jgi:hypothetical protein